MSSAKPTYEPTFTVAYGTPEAFEVYCDGGPMVVVGFDMTIPPHERKASVNGIPIEAEDWERGWKIIESHS